MYVYVFTIRFILSKNSDNNNNQMMVEVTYMCTRTTYNKKDDQKEKIERFDIIT